MKVKLTLELEISPEREPEARAWLTAVAAGAQGIGRLDAFNATGLPERPASLGGAVINVKERE